MSKACSSENSPLFCRYENFNIRPKFIPYFLLFQKHHESKLQLYVTLPYIINLGIRITILKNKFKTPCQTLVSKF